MAKAAKVTVVAKLDAMGSERQIQKDDFQNDAKFRMPGPMRQDPSLARYVHDWFNLAALIPVIVTNLMNWSCRSPSDLCGLVKGATVLDLWHGEAFEVFWWTMFVYFVIDLVYMVVQPICVKSPSVIITHHVVSIGSMMIPYIRQEECAWVMGALALVEVNTWFMIARRMFNKNGDKPFAVGVSPLKSLQLVFVSTCFYASWFVFRLGVYFYVLFELVGIWRAYSAKVGTSLNILILPLPLACVFIYLNVKWTWDLLMSKLKGRTASKGL